METRDKIEHKYEWETAHSIDDGVRMIKDGCEALRIDCREESTDSQKEAMDTLIHAILNSKHMHGFDLNNWNLNNKAYILRVMRGLAHLQKVRYIGLWNNRIDDIGATGIATYLNHRRSLTFLNLQGNLIKDSGALAIAKAVEVHPHLHVLNLAYNQITDEGMTSLGKSIAASKSLRFLELQGNQCGRMGGLQMAHAIEVSGLKYLNISHNPEIPLTVCDHLQEAAKAHNCAYFGPRHKLHDVIHGITITLRKALHHQSKRNTLAGFDAALLAAEKLEMEFEDENDKEKEKALTKE